MWTGAPWTFGILTVMSYAFLAFSGVMGRIEQTMGPQNGPAGSVMILVLNIGTLRPCAMCLTSMPSRMSASSNENEQPIRKPT